VNGAGKYLPKACPNDFGRAGIPAGKSQIQNYCCLGKIKNREILAQNA